ncbi:hypothetical protein PVK06_026459 [Gossypium arboreum]|uniref:Secreted protein n=1 Tax=Gossypium arboreum TaxID=29729 RepID=A0ABR0P075_GOSAR|nr:hypothetical protein PVK06_026459 [Gossypium arboreum]
MPVTKVVASFLLVVLTPDGLHGHDGASSTRSCCSLSFPLVVLEAWQLPCLSSISNGLLLSRCGYWRRVVGN